MQRIEETVLKEFEVEEKNALAEVKSVVRNSEPLPQDSWTARITSKVRISELASEFGVDCCPNHKNNYPIIFDDSRGWFICVKAKYEKNCDCKGNIVNFMERFGRW